MFNPEQVRRWLRSFSLDPSLRHAYEGRHLEEAAIALPVEAMAPRQAPRPIGELRPPSATFGVPYDPSCLYGVEPVPIFSRPNTCNVYPGARVVGASAVLTEDGRLMASQDVQLIGRNKFLHSNDSLCQGFLFEEAPQGIVLRFAARRAPRRIPMNALFLHHLEGGNFGSFMFRQLPQMLAARMRCEEIDCYITPGRTPWFQEALDLLGYPAKPIFTTQEVTGETFQTIMMFDGFDAEGFIDRETRDHLTDLVRFVAWGSFTRGAKVYVSRALSGLSRPFYRPMLNEIEVEERMRAEGFDIVYPETLTFREQIRAFSSASHIVGPSGSGMFNAMFAPSGARIVDIETFNVTVRQHSKLYSSMGHEYALVFAPFDEIDERIPSRRRWQLTADLLDQLLRWVLSG